MDRVARTRADGDAGQRLLARTRLAAMRAMRTAGAALILGERAATLAPVPWPPASFAVTAATVRSLGGSASGQIVPAPKP